MQRTLGQVLKAVRKARRHTQEQAGEAIGMNQSDFSYLERDIRHLKYEPSEFERVTAYIAQTKGFEGTELRDVALLYVQGRFAWKRRQSPTY